MQPGDKLWVVGEAMGLRKSEKIKCIHLIEIVSTRREPLSMITRDDCILEGFPNMKPDEFVVMFCNHYGCPPDAPINRIGFRYIGDAILRHLTSICSGRPDGHTLKCNMLSRLADGFEGDFVVVQTQIMIYVLEGFKFFKPQIGHRVFRLRKI